MAHKLEPNNLRADINAFLRFVEDKYPKHGKKKIGKKKEVRLLYAIGMIYADLSAYLEACKNSKENNQKV